MHSSTTQILLHAGDCVASAWKFCSLGVLIMRNFQDQNLNNDEVRGDELLAQMSLQCSAGDTDRPVDELGLLGDRQRGGGPFFRRLL